MKKTALLILSFIIYCTSSFAQDVYITVNGQKVPFDTGSIANFYEKVRAAQIDNSDGAIGIYKAILSQTNEDPITSGPLEVGRKYRINFLNPGDDFSNVGSENTDDDVFIATGTTPALWTTSQLVPVNAPTATILQNTIGTITWEYYRKGIYRANRTGAFLANKTFLMSTGGDTNAGSSFVLQRSSDDSLLLVNTEDNGRVDGLMTPVTPGYVWIIIYP